MISILVIVICGLLPALVLWLEHRFAWARTLGGVIICYGVGITLGYITDHPVVAQSLAEVAIPLAIPLLLFSVNVKSWVSESRSALLSFGLAVCSVCAVGVFATHLFNHPNLGLLVGMLVGVYTGGTPNMMSVGMALGAPTETFVLLNAADMMFGAFYLFFAMTIARVLLVRVLGESPTAVEDFEARISRHPFVVRDAVSTVMLSALFLGVSLGISYLWHGKIEPAVVFLSLTTLGLAASALPKVRSKHSAQHTANYLVLIFCTSIGVVSNPETLGEAPIVILALTATMLFGSFALHMFLCRIFRIDVDTAIVTSVAAILGPAFVPAVAARLKREDALASGLAMGVIGYAIGNYLGITMGLAFAP
jgi:uncharacterized membrane protein